MTPKSWVKTLAAEIVSFGGGFELLARYALRNRSFILMYHRVLSSRVAGDAFVQPGMYVSTEAFRSQAAFLKRKFTVLPLHELLGRVARGRAVGRCCALTFDDGWHDNFLNAFPVLEEKNLPATIFLPTALVGTDRRFWPEDVTACLMRPEVRTAAGAHPLLARFLSTIPHRAGSDAYYEAAILALKSRPPEERDTIVEALRRLSPAPPAGRVLMNWEEAAVMRASGLIRFESHTSSHVILDQVPLRQAEDEIVRSRHELEQNLGVAPEFFAYPNGNFNGELQSILRRHGFKGAVTTRKGLVEPGASLFEIPRIGVHEDVSRRLSLFQGRILLKRF